MNPETLHTIQVAQESINQLVEMGRKSGPLYRQHPRSVAQVNRTAKWLLNALAALERELSTSPTDGTA